MAHFHGIAFGVTPQTTPTWNEIITARDCDDVRVTRHMTHARADDPATVRFMEQQSPQVPRLLWSEGDPACVGVAVAARDARMMPEDFRCPPLTTGPLAEFATRYAESVARATQEWERFRAWCRDEVGFDPGEGALVIVEE